MFSFFERLLKPTDTAERAEPPPGFIAFFWHFASQARGLFVALRRWFAMANGSIRLRKNRCHRGDLQSLQNLAGPRVNCPKLRAATIGHGVGNVFRSQWLGA